MIAITVVSAGEVHEDDASRTCWTGGEIIEEGLVGGRIEMSTRLRGGEYVLDCCIVETKWTTKFIEQLGLTVGEGKLQPDKYGTVRLMHDQLLTQGLKKGVVKALNRLKMLDGLVQRLVSRRLKLTG